MRNLPNDSFDEYMRRWHKANPAPEPSFTPGQILFELQVIADKLTEGVEGADTLACEHYRRIREKVLLFGKVCPSIVNDPLLKWCVDPHLGLRNLRTWCDEIMRPVD